MKEIKGIANKLGEIDRMGEVIDEDAVITWQENTPVLLNHDQRDVNSAIGTVKQFIKTPMGLEFIADIMDETDEQKDILSKIENNVISNLSIGFIYKGGDYDENDVFHYTNIEIIELSFVNVPASKGSVITGKDAEKKPETKEKGVIFYKSFEPNKKIKNVGEKEKNNDNISIMEENKEIKALTEELSTLKGYIEEMAETKAVDEVAVKDEPNYLDSKQAVKDFENILLDSKSGETFKNAWKSHLNGKVKDWDDSFLPTPIVSQINDVFNTNGEVWNSLNRTGLTALKVDIETAGDKAKVHVKGASKTEQTVTFDTVEILAQYVYKYKTVDRKTVRDNADTGALVKYIVGELANRILAYVEELAIYGGDSDSGFTGIAENVKYTNSINLPSNYTGNDLAEAIIDGVASLKAPGNTYIVMSKGDLAKLKKAVLLSDINLSFDNIAQDFGVNAIYTPYWAVDGKVVGYVGDAYAVVGDASVELFNNFKLVDNKYEYLGEIYAGGSQINASSGFATKVGTAGSDK